MQSVILAAGKGNRLHPFTLRHSKAMLPVVGRPIIDRVMETIAANGIDEFIVVIGPEDHEIEAWFRDESKLGVKVRFITQPEPKGSADALRCAAPLIRGPFLQSACDNLVDSEQIGRMLALWKTRPRPTAILALLRVPIEVIPHTGSVTFDGTLVTRILEKPALDQALSDIASLPIYCFFPRILDYLEEIPLSSRGEYEIQPAIQKLIDELGGVRGLLFPGRLNLTAPADLLTINLHYLACEADRLQISPLSVGPGTELRGPLHIAPGVTLGSRCCIGPNVSIERGCRLGDEVRLKNAVVLPGTRVPSSTEAEGRILS